jgi:asparagine synthetase B (glutamine-hydrolysing)
VNEDGNLYLIGHCRYSTSDLEFNQPLWNENISIVHNGVVSQEMPENWERLYGYKCKTRNDSELILHTLEADKSPLVEFPDASMAVVELYKEKQLRFYRNGKRPIYFTSLRNGVIITSTKDIAIRADLKDPVEVGMNEYVTVAQNVFRTHLILIDNAKDLQHVR